jgi:hypothetical protein
MNVAIATTALACDAYAGGREMWDVLWERMLTANAFGVDRAGFSGFGESVVTGIEVFALFEVVGFGGELAVEAEESLLVGGEGLCVIFSKGS